MAEYIGRFKTVMNRIALCLIMVVTVLNVQFCPAGEAVLVSGKSETLLLAAGKVRGADIARGVCMLTRHFRNSGETGSDVLNVLLCVVGWLLGIGVACAVLVGLAALVCKLFNLLSRFGKNGRPWLVKDKFDRLLRAIWKRPVWIGFDVKKFLTEEESVVAYDIPLDQLRVIGGVLHGGWMAGCSFSRAERIVRSKTEMSFELQAQCAHWDRQVIKGVHVVLRQVGGDVVARADWAAYASADRKYGYNLSKIVKRKIPNDEVGGKVPVATTADADGFGVEELNLAVRSLKPILVNGISGKGGVRIQTYGNGMCLCAMDDGQPNARPILAGVECPSACGQFVIVGNADGTVSIMSKANGKYVSAEMDRAGQLVARAEVVAGWEKFWLTRRKDGRCTLRSCANQKYVGVVPEMGYVGAQAEVAGEKKWLVFS